MMIESGLFLYGNYQRQCIDLGYLDGKLCKCWKQTAFTYMLFIGGLFFHQMADGILGAPGVKLAKY